VERSGFLVASSTNQPIATVQAGEAERIVAGASDDPIMRETMAQLNARFADLTEIGEIQQFTIKSSQSEQWVRVIPFQDQYGLDWLIVMMVPESDFMEAIYANRATTLLLCLLTLGGAMGLGILAADQLTQRFAQLNRVSQELAAGKLDRRLLTNGAIAELNGLAHTFNQMADQIQNAFDRIKTALVESKEKFTAIFRTHPEAAAITTLADGRLLEVNDSFLQFFGYSLDEVVGKTALELQLWSNPAQRDQYRTSLEQQGRVRNLEAQICTRSGEIRTVLLSAEVRTLEGQDCILVTHRDITERKAVELALQQSEERFREIAHTINQLFFVRSIPTGDYLYISPAYEKLWGRSLESLYKNPDSWLDSVHPEDRERVLESVQQQTYMDNVQREYRIIRADGAVRWILTEISVVFDEDGNPLRSVGLTNDITDRKQLEQRLRSQAEAEHLLATITQNIRQSLDLNQILATTVIEVQQTLKADRALIFRLHSDGTGQVIQEAVLPNYPVTDQMRWEDEHFPAECYEHYRQGKPRIVSDIATDEWADCLTEFLQAVGVKSKIVAPIVRTSDQTSSVWGLLIVHACSYPRQWHPSEADFLQQICNQLAIAIDQANLYQQLQTELSERKQAEAILQEREAMLRASGDNLPKGYIYQCSYEPEGVSYTYISAGVERLLGLKPGEVMQNPQLLRIVRFEEDVVAAMQVVREAIKTETAFELQMRNRTADGKIQWSWIRETPRRLADDRVVWDGIEVDITDFKQTEAALRASEEQFRRAFDDAPIGVSLISQTGRYLKVNTCYCNLLGYTEIELLSLTFQDITYPGDLEVELEKFQQMVAGEISDFQLTKQYVTKQGAIVPVLLNAAPVRDQDGQLLYVVAHIQDIRDRLKVEQMKDEFISIVSHELRTPLTSIRGALGILGSGVFADRPEKAQHMLNIAINNSDRLVALVNDILTLERLKSGKVELVIAPCRVDELMQQSIDSVQAIADQSNIMISCTSIAETLWVDSGTVVQTLTNLLSNAIKFSASGYTVWLKAESADENQFSTPHLLFSIKDQGRGIPEDKLNVIFEEFQQVDVSDSREKGGTGLGLTICKKIVQQHGGKIWVESILGEGSTFYVALPLMGKASD
jgi:PAS domain S-box-containing protein